MTLKERPVTGGYGNTFSGIDAKVFMILPECQPFLVGEMSTISYSIYRELGDVRTLGRVNPKSHTRGSRTVAGTMVFTVFDQHVGNRIRDNVAYLRNTGRIKIDEFPPFDLMINFGNEYGATSKIVIYGVQITDEGGTISVEDIFTENTMTYKARDIDLMDGQLTDSGLSRSSAVFRAGNILDVTASFKTQDLLANKSAAIEKSLREINDQRAKQAEEARRVANSTVASSLPQDAQTPVSPVITDPYVPMYPGVPPANHYSKVAIMVLNSKDNSPIDNALVVITAPSGIQQKTAYTGTDGIAYFESVYVDPQYQGDIADAHHTMVVTRGGYDDHTESVTILNDGEFKTTVYLDPIAQPNENILAVIERITPPGLGGAVVKGIAIPEIKIRALNQYGTPLQGIKVYFTSRVWVPGAPSPSVASLYLYNTIRTPRDHQTTDASGYASAQFGIDPAAETDKFPIGTSITIVAQAKQFVLFKGTFTQTIEWNFNII